MKTHSIKKIIRHENVEMIGEGAFGYVFRAPLKCICNEHNKFMNSNYVSKLMTENNAKKEINNIRKLEIIELPILCHSKSILIKDGEKLDTILIYKYKGKTLFQMVNEKMKLDEILIGMESILKEIYELNKKNIFHCDVKQNNILIDDEKNFRLIDFGISIKLDKLEKTDLISLGQIYCIWSMENIFISYYFEEMKVEEVKKILNDITNNVFEKEYNEMISVIIKMNKKEDYEKTFNKLLKIDKDEGIKEIFSKLDVYGFGYVMLYIYNSYKNTMEFNIRRRIWNFIKKLLHANIDERLSIEETLKEYKNILSMIMSQN